MLEASPESWSLNVLCSQTTYDCFGFNKILSCHKKPWSGSGSGFSKMPGSGSEFSEYENESTQYSIKGLGPVVDCSYIWAPVKKRKRDM